MNFQLAFSKRIKGMVNRLLVLFVFLFFCASASASDLDLDELIALLSSEQPELSVRYFSF